MYQFREVTLKNGPHEKKVLAIDFSNPEMKIVGEFLMADASLVNASVLDEIDLVLAGEAEVMETSGNRCGLEIKADQTLIYDLFEDYEDVDTYPAYILDTRTLKELIVMWLDRLEKFNKENR